MNKEALRTLRKTIASPTMAIGIGLLTMAGGGAYTAIEHNVHNKKEILIFDNKSLITRHVQVEANQRKPISRSSYALWAGGGLLGTGILWYLRQPAKAERKANSE